MRKIIFTFIFTISLSSLFGQDKVWTLQECVDYAVKNNLTVKQNEINIISNEASLLVSKGQLAPSINGRATHTYNFGQNVNPVTNSITDLNSRTNTFGLSANVTLFNGLSNYNLIKQRSFLVDASIEDLSQAKNDIGLSVAQSYLQIIFNMELLAAAKGQLATSAEQTRRSKALVDNGSRPIADLLQAQAQEATNKTQVVNRKNELNLSKLQLMQLLQLPYDSAFKIEIPEIEPEDLQPVVLPSEEIYKIALETQPNVRAAANRIEAQEYALSVAKGGRVPSVSAFVGIDTRFNDQTAFSFNEQLQNNLGQNVGLSLNVPIFNSFQVRQSVQVATVNKEIEELNALETKNNLRQQVEQAHLNAYAALLTYESSKQQVEATNLLFENLKRQRAAGSANITDYVVAENNYNQALSDMIRAKFDYIFKLKILDFYQGKPLDF